MSDEKKIHQVTLVGVIINTVLVFIKALVGWLFGSVALIADAVHSLSDLATDAIVFLGVRLGAKPADQSHPYGHGKLETMAAALIAFVLIAAGGVITWKAGQTLMDAKAAGVSWVILVAALASVISKEWVFQKTLQVARQTRSTALKANAWHHRTDALSSLVVLIGALAGMAGWPYGDPVAGIVVGLMVAYAGFQIVLENLNELGEGALDASTLDQLRQIVADQGGVATWHQLRARRVGRCIVMDVHILVDPKLTVVQGHDIAEKVERAVRTSLQQPVNITVHVEPNLPKERNRT